MEFFKKKDASSAPEPPAPPSYAPPPPPRPAPPPAPAVEARPQQPVAPPVRTSQTLLGATLSIRGDVTSEENITIEGVVEGTIETTRDVIVAAEGRVKAGIRGTNIIISGKVKGNIVAMNKVDLTASGQLEGNIHAPKLAIAESALFKGSIDMSQPGEKKAKDPAAKDSKGTSKDTSKEASSSQ
jgi:cytoskeletal protein CcmA (bactofilin family)